MPYDSDRCSLLSVWQPPVVDYERFWWTLLHRITTGMRRAQRFCQRHCRGKRRTTQETKLETAITAATEDVDPNLTPHLPAVVWVTYVLPYLDRVSQNRLCATCKDIYDTSQQVGFFEGCAAGWPQGKYRLKRPILTVAFCTSGLSLAIVPASSKTILLWHRRHGMDQILKGHSGLVSDVTFSSEGILASCSRTDGTIRIWTREEGGRKRSHYTCTKQLALRVFAMRFLRFSPCEQKIAVWGHDRMIRLENINAEPPTNVGSVAWRSRIGLRCCESVVFPKRSNRNILAYTFNNEQVRLWNWDTRSTVELRDRDRTVREGDYDAYVTAMTVVDVETWHGEGVKEYLVVGCRIAMLKLWDLTDYSCVRSFHLGNGWSAVTNIVFSTTTHQDDEGTTSTTTRMACTGDGSQIRVFDVENAKCIAVLTDHKERVESLSFSPDGKTLASGACDRTLRLWNLETILSEQSQS